jgi:hypothetical protein
VGGHPARLVRLLDAAGSSGMTDAEKWAKMAEAWERYCRLGASVFDWDSDSRTLMAELTGVHVDYWYLTLEELAERREAAEHGTEAG